jgi:hypothetical protein
VAWLVLVGAGLVLLGFALLLLVDTPRRALAFVTTLGPRRLRIRRPTPTAGARAAMAHVGHMRNLGVADLGQRAGALGGRARKSATRAMSGGRIMINDGAQACVRAATWLLGR